jgi:DNA-binding transcriptional ArsR family regulator
MGTFVEADADLPLVRLCRRNDPPTSQAAAARARTFKGEHRLRILEALSAGPAGQSAISARTGLSIAQVSKRLGELRRAGAIERDGETRSASGGREARYRVTR